jgi:hypothetical protein
MKFRSHLVVLVGLGLVSSAALADDVYRWTDASGAISYGQKPPADARSVRKVDVTGISVIPSGANSDSDQRLADSYAKSRAQRLEQEMAESHIAAEKARADLDRQTALLEAQRAQADAGCTTNSNCPDQGGFYYPLYGSSVRGAYPGGYGNGYGPGSSNGGSGQTSPVRPRPPLPATNTGVPYPGRSGSALN